MKREVLPAPLQKFLKDGICLGSCVWTKSWKYQPCLHAFSVWLCHQIPEHWEMFLFFFSLCTMPSVDMFMSQICQCEHGINHSITLWSEHFSRMNHIKNLDITATKEHYKKHSFFPQTNEKKKPKVPPFHCTNTYLYQILLIWIWIQFVLNCSGPDCKSVLCEIASLFLYHIYNPNTVSAEKISLFLFSQLVKYHQLHPFDNPLVKGKRQNSNHRQMIL